jgi:DNA polymerase
MTGEDKRKRLYDLLSDTALLLDPSQKRNDFTADLAAFLDHFDPAPGAAETAAEGTPGVRQVQPGALHASSAATHLLQGGSASRDAADPAAGTVAAAEPLPPSDLSREERTRLLEELSDEIRVCRKCPLNMGRTNAVPGEGVVDPLVMIVGEGPGAQEDAQGVPFVGNAGQYLDKWLAAIGLARGENVYIANIVKCRPPNNRDPNPEESDTCLPFLERQIELVRPRLILTVGRISMRILAGTTHGITRAHGTFYQYRGIPLVPTFHPSGVLRNPAWRRPVWEDLKSVRNWLIDNAGLVPPDTQ